MVWLAASPERLADGLLGTLASPSNEVFVSAVTAWEIAIKHASRRLSFPIESYDSILEEMGAESLPILHTHAIAAGALPRHHDDPFDRLLVAQARTESMTLVSADAAIARYDVALFRTGPTRG